MRSLVEGGGMAAEQCLTWVVDGVTAGPGPCVDMVWPATLVEL